jgi:hypothetical protein
MSVRPTLLRDIKKTAAQQHQANIGTGSYNRFTPLTGTSRGRIYSVGKRQLENSDCNDGNAQKAPKLDSNLVFIQLKEQDTILAEADAAIAEIEKSNTENPDPRLDAVLKVLKLLSKSQKNLNSAVTDSCKIAATPTPPALPATGTAPQKRGIASQAPVNTEEARIKKVKTALRDAEKKTVLFNLNLGKNPAMNKETLSRKVTEALGNSVRAGKHDYHIGDAEEVLDDILSCSKLEFLGTQSKLFFNNKNVADTRNNTMYTLPVRMEFKDRECRFEAEVMLRKLCGVNCAVPYPKKMRLLLNEVINAGKDLQPDCFIRTKVNVENLTIEASAKTASGWLDLGIKRNIPLDIIDGNIVTGVSQMTVDEPVQIS